MLDQELVITGVGALGQFGRSPDDLWSVLLDNRSLVSSSEQSEFATQKGELDYAYPTHISPNTAPVSRYALAAAAQAIAQAGLQTATNAQDIAVVFGTANGSGNALRNYAAFESEGRGAFRLGSVLEASIHSPATLISIEYGFRGPLVMLPMGWAAGCYALSVAADFVKFGMAPAAVVVASDETIADVVHGAYKALGLLSPNDGKARAVRPFDLRRNGAVLGSGAAAVIVETREHALQRGATPLMRLAGWALASDSFGIGAKGRGRASIGTAMEAAMRKAERNHVDVVYSGSYCTTDADHAEATAIAAMFNSSTRPPVTNIRGTLGEIGCVTGMFNVLAAGCSLHSGTIPPTLGSEELDPYCDLDVVTATRRLSNVESALCNAFWVNGVNASVVLEKYQ
ncbi:MAG: hypothetical protein H7Y02_06345 [Candidatus Obscuribacterales bacterium]|nr:hypothetical protein [Steroidobacteraceae bacterium]